MAIHSSAIFPNQPCIYGLSPGSRSSNCLVLKNCSITCSVRCTLQSCSASSSSFRWAKDGSLPEMTPKHILPDDKRPMLSDLSYCGIPVVDMDDPTDLLVEKVTSACEEYGFFQVINHKVPLGLCNSMLNAVTEFFHLPPEEKALLFSDDATKEVRVCNHYRKDQGSQDRIPLWSEVFKHHPVDDFTGTLQLCPPKYREVITAYAKHVDGLMTWILALMSQGLGLEMNCLNKRMGESPTYRVQANYYPPCPEPELTLGLGVHTDRDSLTVVLATPEVKGLQVMKGEKWVEVEPIPGALIVNLGDQLQVLSNGRYSSVLHRVATNKTMSRVSLATFYGPSKVAIIGPIEDLVDEKHPPIYRTYQFLEFLEEFRRQEGNRRRVKEAFKFCG